MRGACVKQTYQKKTRKATEPSTSKVLKVRFLFSTGCAATLEARKPSRK